MTPSEAGRPTRRTAGFASLMLLLGLFVAIGVLTQASSSAPPSTRWSVERTGPGESTIWFVHPAWGPVKLVTHRNSDGGGDPGPAWLTVTDTSGAVRFSWENEHMRWFAPAGTRTSRSGEGDVRSPVDALGRVFFDYDPGRYNGVVVLVPTPAGFDDLGTLPPPPDDYAGRFYCGGATDLGGDGIYEIVKPRFCECTAVCEPDTRGHTFRWRDADYVEQ